MIELNSLDIPTVSTFLTAGLSSARQLVDTTSNEIYSFKDSTSELKIIPIFYPSVHQAPEQNQEIDTDQSWYWSEFWQVMEREATKNLEEGDYEEFDNMDDFIASL